MWKFFGVLCALIVHFVTTTLGQNRLPTCTAENLYYISNGVIYEYNVVTRSHVTVYTGTTSLGNCLGIGAVLGNYPGINGNTYHVTVNGQHHYIDPNTLQLINTGHTAIGANLGYGSNLLFNYNGFNQVSKYDGFGNATIITTLTYNVGESSIMPAIIGDCDDNFYILTNRGLRQYDSNGVLQTVWTYALGTNSPPSGGGMAFTNDSFYTINGPNIQVFYKNNINNTLTFVRTVTGLGRSGFDMSNCAGTKLSNIHLTALNTERCDNNFIIVLNNPNTQPTLSKQWYINGNLIASGVDSLSYSFGPTDTQVVCKVLFEQSCGNPLKSDTLRISPHSFQSKRSLQKACSGLHYQGAYYTHDTLITSLYKSSLGCDSLLLEHDIKIGHPDQILEKVAVCAGSTWHMEEEEFSEPGAYTWTYVNSFGCDSIRTYQLSIIDKPIVAFKGLENEIYCINDTVQLNFGFDGLIYFEGNRVARDHINIQLKQEQNNIIYTVKSSEPCEFKDSIQLLATYCCDVFVPNAFSPNADGINDVFMPIINGNSIETFTIQIFNRWGAKVYESIHNTKAWDGTYNGLPVDAGVYFYYLTYYCAGVKNEKTGDLTVIR